jgi:hypothetical protein
VVARFRELGLTLNPTFVTFTPWTTVEGYIDLLQTLVALDLVANVPPIQYAIRLLIPAGSRLLELPDVQALVEPFDERALAYPWTHPDPRVDTLYEAVRRIAREAPAYANRRDVFEQIWRTAHAAAPRPAPAVNWRTGEGPPTPIPFLSEAWFC